MDAERFTARRLAGHAAGLVLAVAALLPLAEVCAGDAPVRLEQEPRTIFESVARQMNVTLRDDEPLPAVRFESSTPLARFQDAIAAQWRFRPPVFANAYAVATNEIYLTDDPRYYRRLRRTLDESLAHEFAHYLQVRYFNADLSQEQAETEAVAVQVAFRIAAQTLAPGEAG